MEEFEFACGLSDEESVLHLKRCAREDREVTARLLAHLGNVEARGLFRDEGFSSMFDYAVRELHMSEDEAALRIRTARLVRKFPEALGMLARGELHLTALRLLSPVLTRENVSLLGMARHKSKFEVQELIAKYFPQPDVRSSIRRLPGPARLASEHLHHAGSQSQVACEPRAAMTEAHADRTSSEAASLAPKPTPILVEGCRRPAVAAATNASANASGSEAANLDVADNASWGASASGEVNANGSGPAAAGAKLVLLEANANGDLRSSFPCSDLQLCANGVRSDERVSPSAEMHSDSSSHDELRRLAEAHVSPSARGPETLQSEYSRGAGPERVHARTPVSAANVPVPLSAGRYKIKFTASTRFCTKLEQASELLRYQVPRGNWEVVFERALDLLIAERKKQMFGVTDKPRRKSSTNASSVLSRTADDASAKAASAASRTASDARASAISARSRASDEPIVIAVPGDSRASDEPIAGAESRTTDTPIGNASSAQGRSVDRPLTNAAAAQSRSPAEPVANAATAPSPTTDKRAGSRYVPRELRRQVYARDGGRCCFVGSNGKRCAARDLLEFHHVVPYALGGEMTLSNIQLRCRAHNVLEAERDYGRSVLQQRILSKRRCTDATLAPNNRYSRTNVDLMPL